MPLSAEMNILKQKPFNNILIFTFIILFSVLILFFSPSLSFSLPPSLSHFFSSIYPSIHLSIQVILMIHSSYIL